MKSFLFWIIAISSLNAGRLYANETSNYTTLLAPRILKLTSKSGIERLVCLAMFRNSKNNKIAQGVADAGPGRSCPSAASSYIVDEKASESRGMDTFVAKFVGRDAERFLVGGTSYYMELDPAALIYRTTDASGKESFEAVCVTVNRSVDSSSARFSVAYPRTNIADPIQDFKSKVECGGITYAMQHELKMVKPDFIGSPAELSATSSHPQLIQSGVSIGLPVSETHK